MLGADNYEHEAGSPPCCSLSSHQRATIDHQSLNRCFHCFDFALWVINSGLCISAVLLCLRSHSRTTHAEETNILSITTTNPRTTTSDHCDNFDRDL